MKKYIIPIMVLILCVATLVLDYNEYTLMEEELQQDMFESVSEIIGPEGKDYQLQYSYAKGRLRFYSGEIYRDTQKIPFIYAYKKHWLFSSYRRDDYVLRYSDTQITHHGPEIETVIFEYVAMHRDESLTLQVERSFNRKLLTFLVAYGIVIFLGRLFREK